MTARFVCLKGIIDVQLDVSSNCVEAAANAELPAASGSPLGFEEDGDCGRSKSAEEELSLESEAIAGLPASVQAPFSVLSLVSFWRAPNCLTANCFSATAVALSSTVKASARYKELSVPAGVWES